MRMKLLVGAVLLVGSNVAFAGLTGLTHASRANCGNNESISWDATRARNLGVTSVHYLINGSFYTWMSKPNHSVQTGARYNVYRAAAVHWGESFTTNKYVVLGHHWEQINSSRSVYRRTTTSNCSMYDGWL